MACAEPRSTRALGGDLVGIRSPYLGLDMVLGGVAMGYAHSKRVRNQSIYFSPLSTYYNRNDWQRSAKIGSDWVFDRSHLGSSLRTYEFAILYSDIGCQ